MEAINETPVTTGTEKNFKGFTSFSIKLIAVVTMFIDHAAAIILERYMDSLGMSDDVPQFVMTHAPLYFIYTALRCIGRIAFPIYIFLLVQGFMHTHNRLKYAIRLFAFALISEIPFNLAFGKALWTMQYQNVFWTLLCGFLFMWFSDFVYSKNIKPWLGYVGIVLGSIAAGILPGILLINGLYYFGIDVTAPLKMIVVFAAFAAIMAIVLILVNRKKTFTELSQAAFSLAALSVLMLLAQIFNTDYAAFGVLAIAVAYIFRKDNSKSFGLSMIPLIISSFIEAFALLDLIVIKKYNGERGRSMKYFFYAFYPCHIIILYLIACLLGFGN